MTLAGATIRPLTDADADACTALARSRGWDSAASRWRLLLGLGAGFGIDDPAGGLAATVVVVPYGTTLAALSMMLVAERHGRQGLARRLVARAMAAAGDRTVLLYATPYGRPVYERAGFRVVATVATHVGRFRARAEDRPPPGVVVRAAGAGDLAVLARLDAVAFGADRSALLARLPAFADALLLAERDGSAAGYAAAWDKNGTRVVGPVIADGAGVARALVGALAAGAPGPVRLDLETARDELPDWADARGVTRGEVSWLMVHGGRALPGVRARVLVPVMLALG